MNNVAKGKKKGSLESSIGNTGTETHILYQMLIIEQMKCSSCSSHRWYYFIKSSYAARMDSVPNGKVDANAVHHPRTILNCSSIIHPINPPSKASFMIKSSQVTYSANLTFFGAGSSTSSISSSGLVLFPFFSPELPSPLPTFG
jgi:hypothetical protein